MVTNKNICIYELEFVRVCRLKYAWIKMSVKVTRMHVKSPSGKFISAWFRLQNSSIRLRKKSVDSLTAAACETVPSERSDNNDI